MTALPEQLELETFRRGANDDGAARAAGDVVAPRRGASTSRIGAIIAGRDLGRLFRYGATSVIALVVSEICLVTIDAETAVGVTVATVAANLAGTVPSYVLSRYWIWSEADRARAGRQVALYWLVSLVSMALSSIAMGAIAHENHERHILRLLVLGAFYLVVSIALWVAKYVAYHTVIFRTPPPSGEVIGELA